MSIKKISVFILAIVLTMPLLKAQYVDEARQLIEKERYISVETLLEKTIETSEPGPEINYLLIKTYLEQDKKEEAGIYISRHLEPTLYGNTDPLNRIAYARYLLNTGNKKTAEGIFTSILSNKKSHKNAVLLLAMAEVVIEEENGDVKPAFDWLDMAEKRDRDNAAIDMARGLAYRKLNDASGAYLAYQNALKKDPDNARAHYLMGKIFVAQKNPEAYMQYFTKAYASDSTYAPVLKELYNHYYYQNVRIAKKYLEKYMANTDYSLRNDYYLTDIFYLNGEFQNAIQLANSIITKEASKAQPRLYKLIAYSYLKSGDSAKALQSVTHYFAKEDPAKVIAADFQLIAQLTEKIPGQEEGAIAYYSIAAEMDTLRSNKADYAEAIAGLYTRKENHSKQALWLGKVYEWKEKANNIDLFNWGLAHYMAKEFRKTDSVFEIYTTLYPDDIYGYYWRAQANASIDSSMTDSLAVPFYYKVVEIGEKNKEINKKMLLKAYGYLGGYEANVTKNYPASLLLFEKYITIEENADVAKYIEMLQKWIAEKN